MHCVDVVFTGSLITGWRGTVWRGRHSAAAPPPAASAAPPGGSPASGRSPHPPGASPHRTPVNKVIIYYFVKRKRN